MKANELRIGNWLKYTNDERIKSDRKGKEFQVVPDDIVFLYDYDIDYVLPIPLTEEWLLKFGFEKANQSSFDKDDYEWIYEIGKRTNTRNFDISVGKYVGGNLVAFLYSGDALDIQYVHQLQNLYFALTGQELEIR